MLIATLVVLLCGLKHHMFNQFSNAKSQNTQALEHMMIDVERVLIQFTCMIPRLNLDEHFHELH